MPIKDFSCSPVKLYLVNTYLYNQDDPERDTVCVLGIASTREKADVLIEEWADSLMNGEDAYKDLEEIETEDFFGKVKSYKGIDDFGDRVFIDIVISEVELDKVL